MSRREFLKTGAVALVAAPAVVSAGTQPENPLAIRASMTLDDIGYFEGLSGLGVEIMLDGVNVDDRYSVVTIDEPGGFIIGKRTDEKWEVDNKGNIAFRKIDGNFTISGLSDEQRAAHIDRMKHRALMDSNA